MTSKSRIAIVVAVVGAAGVIVAVLVTGVLGLGGSGGGQAVSVEQQATDPFEIYLVQSGDPGAGPSRFTFPFSDIERQSDYSAFSNLLTQLPGSQFSAAEYQVFRTKDRIPLTPAATVSAVSEGNTAVLVLPNEAIDALGGAEPALTFYFSRISAID